MSKFGWCSTGHHDTCRIKYINWNNNERVCSCECHTQDLKGDSMSDQNLLVCIDCGYICQDSSEYELHECEQEQDND